MNRDAWLKADAKTVAKAYCDKICETGLLIIDSAFSAALPQQLLCWAIASLKFVLILRQG